MPFKNVSVETPQGICYDGKRMSCTRMCGVSILRAGETMEQAVSEVCKNIRIGKILIQTNQSTGEPELYYLRLPKDIKDYRVVLMDATVATGAAAIMAIRVLLDHDVPEENILLVSLLMAEIGVHSIAYAFPKVSTTSIVILVFFYLINFISHRFKLLHQLSIPKSMISFMLYPASAILAIVISELNLILNIKTSFSHTKVSNMRKKLLT